MTRTVRAAGGASRDRARPRHAKQDVAAALNAMPNIQQQDPHPPLAGPKSKVRTAEAAHTDEYRSSFACRLSRADPNNRPAAETTLTALLGLRSISNLSPEYASRRTFADASKFMDSRPGLQPVGFSQTAQFIEAPHGDLPDGLSAGFPVEPFSQKYSASRFPQIKTISIDVLFHSEGRFANVTDVGAGCGGRSGALTTRLATDGEVVWS